MGLLFGLCLILGILCLFYYGVITLYAGIGTAFAWFWISAGICLIVLGFVVRYMMKNEIKLPDPIRVVFLAVITIGMCIFILLEGILIYYSSKEADPKAEYLIVLGAQVRGTTITKSLKKRLDTAVTYLSENPETKVIVSGGQGPGEDITEAGAMKEYLISKGIAEDRIMKEDRSTDTNENIRYSKELIKDKNSSVVIVTNGFHIFRATGIAKKQGFTQVQGLAAPSDRILTINYYVREAVGVLKDFIYGNI